MKRAVVIATAVATAGTVAAAILTTSGGAAQAPAMPRSITFVATSTGGFEPTGRHHAGETSGFADRLRSADGTVTGRDVGVCTLHNLERRESFCRVQMLLSNGQISFQGVIRENLRSFVFVVIGGTGAYEGAGGEARITPLSDSTTRVAVDLS
jgi:hypothetical protein